jgi:hypothetical protein
MLEHLNEAIKLSVQAGIEWKQFRKLVQDAYFDRAVEEAKGNQCHAAKNIHVHRNTVGRIYGYGRLESIVRG